jgi:hypothetical protein
MSARLLLDHLEHFSRLAFGWRRAPTVRAAARATLLLDRAATDADGRASRTGQRSIATFPRIATPLDHRQPRACSTPKTLGLRLTGLRFSCGRRHGGEGSTRAAPGAQLRDRGTAVAQGMTVQGARQLQSRVRRRSPAEGTRAELG